jgi:hypothetical protein
MKDLIIHRAICVLVIIALIGGYKGFENYHETKRCQEVMEGNLKFLGSVDGIIDEQMLRRFNKIDKCN